MFGGWAGETHHVGLTLYTDAYVVRGTLGTRQRRLSDVLNLADDDFLVLADAEFEEFGHRGERNTARFAQVNLAAVLFAVADTTVTPVPELRSPKVAETALISIPPFKVTGRIHLMPGRDLREALQELTGRFIPVTNATYWSDSVGEAPREAPMVAINHARAQILSPWGDLPADEGPAGEAPDAASPNAESPDAGEPTGWDVPGPPSE
ncbi:MAG TPA: hypothetical protein VFX65_12380 [Candidatus Limnocylindrales bacterium]|nr:hypothetical protein [Candidatus Limnocylindrales bacterium]